MLLFVMPRHLCTGTANNFAWYQKRRIDFSSKDTCVYKIEKIHIEDWVSATRYYKPLNNLEKYS